MARGRPHDSVLVFPTSQGTVWTDFHYRNWRRRVFGRAVEAAGLEDVNPYDLRHSFVSLLLAEGASVVEVAQQAGHSPTMTLNTYAHVMHQLAGAKRRPAAIAIREARVKVRKTGS